MSTDQPPPPPMQPPPPPAFSPPKTSYHAARQKELDAIRRKGLTKIFNKHFNMVASKIQEERAAAELALAELEKRKAELASNPKSFSGGMTLTQLDQLYMELKKRKDDVHRKERETQELYRRYVSQYGGEDGKIDASRKGMPLINEYSPDDIIWQSDLMLTKSTEMNEATKDSDVGKLANNFNEVSHNEQPYKQISSSAEVSKQSNATKHVSVQPEQKRVTASSVTQEISSKPFDSPAPTSVTSADSNFPDAVPQDCVTTTQTPSVSLLQHCDTNDNDDSLLGGVMVTTKSSNNLGDGDDSDSSLSGLTTIDGATVVEAEWRLTEFLRIETENIRQMLAHEEGNKIHVDGQSSDNNDYPSIVAGEVSEAAMKAEEMVKQMEAATAWMNDPTLLDCDSDEEKEDIFNESPNHVWRSYWSEEHEREYYHNVETQQTCWTKPKGVDIDFSSLKKSNRQSDSTEKENNETDSQSAKTYNIGDEDSVTVKDYTKSRRKVIEQINPAEYTNEEMIDIFLPDSDNISVGSMGSTKQSSKVLQYRRKRARMRRMKIRLRIAFVLVVIIPTILFIHRDQLRSTLHDITNKSSLEENIASMSADEEVPLILNSFDETSEDANKERNEGDEMPENLEIELESLDEAETIPSLQNQEDNEEKEPNIADKAEELPLNGMVRDVAFDLEDQQEKEDQVVLAEEKEESKLDYQVQILEENVGFTALQEVTDRIERPWACAIPFAHIPSRKCSSLAKTIPLYDCHALVDSMME